jgi:hypothetical protein
MCEIFEIDKENGVITMIGPVDLQEKVFELKKKWEDAGLVFRHFFVKPSEDMTKKMSRENSMEICKNFPRNF